MGGGDHFVVLSVCPMVSAQYLLKCSTIEFFFFFYQTWYGGVLSQGDVSCRKIGSLSLSSVSRSQRGLVIKI